MITNFNLWLDVSRILGRQMKILKILQWILYIAVFVLAVVLTLDNIQAVEFNFFGIYGFKLPLIAMAAVFLGLGVIIGFLLSMFQKIGLKAQIHKLTKEVEELKKSSINTAAR